MLPPSSPLLTGTHPLVLQELAPATNLAPGPAWTCQVSSTSPFLGHIFFPSTFLPNVVQEPTLIWLPLHLQDWPGSA